MGWRKFLWPEFSAAIPSCTCRFSPSSACRRCVIPRIACTFVIVLKIASKKKTLKRKGGGGTQNQTSYHGGEMGRLPVAWHWLAEGWRWAELDWGKLYLVGSLGGVPVKGLDSPCFKFCFFLPIHWLFISIMKTGGKWTSRLVPKDRICVPYALLRGRLGMCLCSLLWRSWVTWLVPSSSPLWVWRIPLTMRMSTRMAQIAGGGTSASQTRRYYLGWSWYSFIKSGFGCHFCITTLVSVFIVVIVRCLKSFSSIGGA